MLDIVFFTIIPIGKYNVCTAFCQVFFNYFARSFKYQTFIQSNYLNVFSQIILFVQLTASLIIHIAPSL